MISTLQTNAMRTKSLTKTYSYEEVYNAPLKYFDGDELAASTWVNKYCMKNNEGKFAEASPDDMHRRMAREFARVEMVYKLKVHLNGSAKYLSAYGQQREFLDE